MLDEEGAMLSSGQAFKDNFVRSFFYLDSKRNF